MTQTFSLGLNRSFNSLVFCKWEKTVNKNSGKILFTHFTTHRETKMKLGLFWVHGVLNTIRTYNFIYPCISISSSGYKLYEAVKAALTWSLVTEVSRHKLSHARIDLSHGLKLPGLWKFEAIGEACGNLWFLEKLQDMRRMAAGSQVKGNNWLL